MSPRYRGAPPNGEYQRQREAMRQARLNLPAQRSPENPLLATEFRRLREPEDQFTEAVAFRDHQAEQQAAAKDVRRRALAVARAARATAQQTTTDRRPTT